MVSYNQKGKGDIKWQDVLTLIVVTTGKKNGSLTPLATIMTLGLRLVNMMRRKKKMKITFDVLVSKRMEIDIPAHWMPYVEAWLAGDDERTDEQWDLVENHSWNEIVNEFLPEDEEAYDVGIYSKSENEDEEEEEDEN